MRADTSAWNEEKIKSKIKEMVEKTGIERMPSHKEMQAYFGDTRLTNAISKRQGSMYFSNVLGLPMKNSETKMGKKYEKYAVAELLNLGYTVEETPHNFSYDLLVNGMVKIDVKSSRMYKGETGNFYSCNLEHKFPTCDLFVIYLVGEDEGIDKRLVIPSSHVARNSQISIGEKTSKYYKYEDMWWYVKAYIDAFSKI